MVNELLWVLGTTPRLVDTLIWFLGNLQLGWGLIRLKLEE